MRILSTIIFIIMSLVNLNAQIEKVEDLFSDYRAGESPGASVLVAMNGKIVFVKTYGYANLEEKIFVETKTNFRLASVTKQFTAAAVSILVQRELLNLETKLTDIFTDFPAYGNKITIKHLLTHTSGLIDYEDLIPDTTTIQVKDADVLRMIITQHDNYFEPGTQFKYSNTGYALLLLMVEKISRISFAKFLEENIFKPLQMNNTVAHEEGISVVNNRAYGYVRTDTEWMRKDQSITSAVLGDGGIYSNVKDLFKWDQSLYTNGILSDDLRLISMTRAILKSGEKIDYGYGWHLKSYKGNEIVYHGGSTQGFRNVIYRVPSKKFTVIILTNRNEGEPEKIAERIFDLYFKY
ncbi:MAG TPA: serine hydrolase domain-containing protein [Ignavibacteriaceae bacterium]